MPQWEYRGEFYGTGGGSPQSDIASYVTHNLTELGREGWELVNVQPVPRGGEPEWGGVPLPVGFLFVFKRQRGEQVPS